MTVAKVIAELKKNDPSEEALDERVPLLYYWNTLLEKYGPSGSNWDHVVWSWIKAQKWRVINIETVEVRGQRLVRQEDKDSV